MHILSLAGYHEVELQQLVEPEWARLYRVVDHDHVKTLKKEFLKNPGGCFTMMVVHADVQRKDFDIGKISQYKLEVLGGNHSRVALQQIIEEELPCVGEKYTTRMAKIYCGLNMEEARRIARDHNHIHAFGKEDTFMDIVNGFRTCLYVTMGATCAADTEVLEPSKDKKVVGQWKDTLAGVTGTENVSLVFILYI